MKPIREFKPGQKVRNQYGQTQTVLFQRGIQVWLVEDTSGWHHPAKLWPVEEPARATRPKEVSVAHI